MTKAEELRHLDTFIATLGRDSYLGPWLSENRYSIARDMESDTMPRAPLPGAAYEQARAILLEAHNADIAAREKFAQDIDKRRADFDTAMTAAIHAAANLLDRKAEDLRQRTFVHRP